jgi:MFS family permease
MAGTDHTHDSTHAAPTVRTDTVQTEGATVTRGSARDAVVAQRSRFGGIKWGAAFFGWLSANGLAVILVALLSAGGLALGLAQGVDTANEAVDQANEIGIGGGIAILVVLFLAYLAGGYVAGRMARFDGARQGLAVWIIGLLVVLVLAAAGAILGSKYNVLQDLNLPRIPVDEGTATTAGIITLVAILLVTLAGAVLGGKLGDRYHRRVDRAGFDV